MNKNELDKNLETRIMLLDLDKNYFKQNIDVIDTSYAKKALRTHDVKDFAKAIIEARKLTSRLGSMWATTLENYFNSYYNSNLEEVIASIDNVVPNKEIDETKIEDIYSALENKETPNHSKLDEELEKQVGFTYEERPDYLKDIEKQVIDAKNTNNLARTLTTLEKLKEIIDLNELPTITPLYQKWYDELNDVLSVNTDKTFDEVMNIKEENRNEYINDGNKSILSTINNLMDKKVTENKDQSIEYDTYVLDTTDCNTLDDMYVKYAREIDEEYNKVYSKITRLMQSVDSQVDVSDLSEEELKVAQDLRRAKYIFEQDRLENNTEDDHNEDTYREIVTKCEELKNLINKDDIDFTNSKKVFYWVQELVPYINIEPVTLKETPIDKYLLELLGNNGYTSEKVIVNDIDTFYKNMLAKELKELDEYHFIVSEYDKSRDDNERLTSDKVKDIANLNYHKELYYESERRLGHINKKLESISELRATTSVEFADKKKFLEERLQMIEEKIASINDLTVTSQIFKTEDTESYEAYNLAVSNPNVNTLTNMFTAISKLHDSNYKDKMLIAGYNLLDNLLKEEKISKKDFNSIELSNKLTYIKRKNMNNILEEKEDLVEDLAEFDDKVMSALNEIEETEKMLKEEKEKYEDKSLSTKQALTELANSLKEKGYVDKSEEFKNLDIEEEKIGLFDKFKNLFNRSKQENKEINKISQEEETLNDFQPIRRIKPIRKSLYNTVNDQTVKGRISEGIRYIKSDIKKNPAIYASIAFMYVGLAVLATATIIENNNDDKNKEMASERKIEDITIEESEITDIEIPYIDVEEEMEEAKSK